MTRWLACVLIAVGGCVGGGRDDPTLTADLACEAARLVVQLRAESGPAPASDLCTNCGGTGKLGDGRIEVKCPACDGTGKAK